MSRIKETGLILFLLIIPVFGMAWLISAVFESEQRRNAALFGKNLRVLHWSDITY